MPKLKSGYTATNGQKIPQGTEVQVTGGDAVNGYTVQTTTWPRTITGVAAADLDPPPETSPPPKAIVAKDDTLKTAGTAKLATVSTHCESEEKPVTIAPVELPSEPEKKTFKLEVVVKDDDDIVTQGNLDAWKLEDATVKVMKGTAEVTTAKTGKDGNTTFTLREDDYTVTAEKADYSKLSTEVWTTSIHLDKNIEGADAVVRTLVPRVRAIEVGAGSGPFSAPFKTEFSAIKYYSTDLEAEGAELFRQTDTEPALLFLGEITDSEHLRPIFGVNANQLQDVFQNACADVIIGVNNYGSDPSLGRDAFIPEASYGLAKYPTGFRRKNRDARFWGMVPDTRFLSSALLVLKPGGKVILRCKSNILAIVAEATWTATTDLRTLRRIQGQLAAHNRSTGLRDSAMLTGINQFAQTDVAALQEFARLGYAITVKSASPPRGVVGKAADTGSGSSRSTNVSPYNTELIFTKGGAPSFTCEYGFINSVWSAT